MLIPVLSLFATMCTPPPEEVAAVPYATQKMIAVSCGTRRPLSCAIPRPDAGWGTAQVAWDDGEVVGQLVLFVRGKFLNQGANEIDMKLPKFCSAEGKTYEGEDLYIKGVTPQELGISLNPDQEYTFVAYYFFPLAAVIGGKLIFADDEFDSEERGEVDLHFDRSTSVEDKLTKKGITDNPFDAMD